MQILKIRLVLFVYYELIGYIDLLYSLFLFSITLLQTLQD